MLERALLMLFFAWHAPQSVRRVGSKMKCSDTCNTFTFKLITGASTLTIEHYVFSVHTRLIVEIFFMLFSVYNAVKWAEKE